MTASKPAIRPMLVVYLFILLALAALAGGCSLAAETTPPDDPPPTETTAAVVVGEDTPTFAPSLTRTSAPTAETLTPAPSPTRLPPELATQTRAAKEALAAAETQFALLQQATLTPCADKSCFTATPSRTPWVRPSRTPSPTPGVPEATLFIWNPGPMSKLVSPIKLYVYAHTGANGLIQVELLGEDGRMIYRQVLRYGSTLGALVPVQIDVPFEISAVAETGRLVVSIEDASKRPIAVTACDVILQSLGSNELTPTGDGLQPITFQQPYNNQIYEGGVLKVKGLARSSSSEPMILELINTEGTVIASKQLALEMRADGTHAPFEIEIPYEVSRMTDVRLVARQQSDRLPGIVALSSVQVWLKP